MSRQPLAEVFGFPVSNVSEEAERFRNSRLCRFGNKVPNCTKDKANDPLGVCSIFDGNDIAITCPVRFRENWMIAEDAAKFFFPPQAKWTTLSEVRIKDAQDKSAGNIDLVLVSYDNAGRVQDFGALEVQAVYISGNVRQPFEHYINNRNNGTMFDWSNNLLYPRADYLSSSRKRLVPQLMFKGGILKSWQKKTAVALTRPFFSSLPELESVNPEEADMVWLIYDLELTPDNSRRNLVRRESKYTKFFDSLEKLTTAQPGELSSFIEVLQQKIDSKFGSSLPPDNETINAVIQL